MSNRLSTLTFLSLLSTVAACSSPSSTSSPAAPVASQTVRGTVTLSAYALDNPVVVGRTADGRSFFAPVQVDGSFSLTLPAAASVQLSLANTTAAGTYVLISRIVWPADNATWARLDGTSASITLGQIHPSSAGPSTCDHGSSASGSSSGGGDDSTKDGGDNDDGDDNDGAGELHACGTAAPGRSDLPYDVQPQVGSTFKLDQAFLAKGPLPKAITSVTMQGGTWRLTELQNDTPFVITQDDCTHQGNRDVGRDRVVVSWVNADGLTASDHLDLRYCDGSGSSSGGGGGGGSGSSGGGSGSSGQGMDPNDCESDGTAVCAEPGEGESKCDGAGSGMHADDAEHADDPACAADGGTTGAGGSGNGATSSGGGAAGGAAGGSGGGEGAGGDGNGAAGNGGAASGGASGATGGTGAAGGAGNGATAGGGAAGGGANGSTTGAGTGQPGDACTVNADCGAGLVCMASLCTTEPTFK